MVNITKIRALCKANGIKQGYLCSRLSLSRTYFNDIDRGKATMSDERICKVAELLGTSFEYLTDQTEDPSPVGTQPDGGTKREIIKIIEAMSPSELEALAGLLRLPPRKREYLLKAVAE